ncbi:hypothetical protein OAL23_01270, partial [bacterium]|nr:hypothetical protein [bacterium]
PATPSPGLSSPPKIAPPPPPPPAGTALPPPPKSPIPAGSSTKHLETDGMLRPFFESFPESVTQQSNYGLMVVAFAQLPASERPTADQLQKLSRDMQGSWLWTLKRLGHAPKAKLPTIQDLIRNKKWAVEITPAISPDQLKVSEEATGEQELPWKIHDQIVQHMIKDAPVERSRDNGQKEYRKPLNLRLPEDLASLVKKKVLAHP